MYVVNDPENIVAEDITDDNILKVVAAKRLNILLGDGETNELELSLMKQLTDTAMAGKRLASENSNSAADREVSAALTRVMLTMNANPFEITTDRVISPDIPKAELVTEENSTTLATLECDPDLAS